MAVLLNIISSGSRKSAGAATFRRVRGRTIMSQKRGGLSASAMETRAAAGLVRTYREAMFYIVTSFCAGMAQSINASFEPTKYGSSRNAFFKLNYSAIEEAVNGWALGLALLDQLMHQVSFSGVSLQDGETQLSFTGFDATNFDLLMSRVSVSVVRITRGGNVRYISDDSTWAATPDPTGAQITSFEVAVSPATSSGQQITSVRVTSSLNFVGGSGYDVYIQGYTLTGSWSGNTFVVTNSPYFTDRHTVYIRKLPENTFIAQRVVDFSTSGTEAGGE